VGADEKLNEMIEEKKEGELVIIEMDRSRNGFPTSGKREGKIPFENDYESLTTALYGIHTSECTQ